MTFLTVDTTSPALSVVLTGREYSRMATKRITMKRRRSPMKRHLNLRHTMNFMVLHGLVNQKKEVSGRLVWENERLYENMMAFTNQCTASIILGRVQFRVHVGFISAFSCRPDICICFTYNLQAHLHFTLKTQAAYIRTMYNSNVLQVNAADTSLCCFNRNI